MKLLQDKVAIVTGAGKPDGMGRATAIMLADAGARVVVTDLLRGEEDRRDLDYVVEEIRSRNGNAMAVAVDVTDRKQIDACVVQTCNAYGGIDILFNNAGTGVGAGPFLELSDTHWDLNYRINLKGMADFCQAVIPVMQERGGGAIINNSSMSGLGTVPLLAAYTATKFGVIGLTKSIACEFGVDNIRCNAICPGIVETGMGKSEIELFTETGKSTEQTKRKLASEVALQQRWAQPEEIAEVVVFLAGPGAGYITGVALPVAGGMAAGL